MKLSSMTKPLAVISTAAVLLVSAAGLGVFSAIVTRKNNQLYKLNLSLDETNIELKAANARESDARTLAESNEQAAREQSQLALSTLTSVISDIQGGLKQVPGGVEVRRRLLQTSLEKLDSVAKGFVEQAALDRNG